MYITLLSSVANLLYTLYFKMSCVYCCELCVLLLSYVYLLFYVCTAVFTLDAGLLTVRQYSEGHIDTGFSWFPCV